MYKAIIVDDEKLIIEGLKNIIDWEELNIEIVDTAENGKDALKIFEEKMPNIVISDINMPLINGIDLLTQIKKIDDSVRCVILSGYEDFNYAKAAISIGVEDYILKPIDEKELIETLKKIVKSLDKEKETETINIKKESLLKGLLNGINHKSEIIELKNILKIDLEDSVFVTSILLIEDAFTTLYFKNINKTEVLYDDYGNTIFINSFKKGTSFEEIKLFYNDILKDIIKNYGKNILISIGDVVDNISCLDRSFKTSNIVKKNVLVSGFNKCLTREDIKKDIDVSFENEINEINRLIVNNEKDLVNSYLSDMLDSGILTPRNIYEFAIKVLILYDTLKVQHKVNSDDIDGVLGNSIIKVLNFTKIIDIKKYLISKIDYLMENIQDENIKLSPIVRRIVKCINENYYKDLSLKVLATEYNVNTSYLGQVFTKELGVQFSEYLNKVRNSVAKDLILNTNKKISDISKEVGYLDTSYFYRKFKKYYGVTPATLRELQNY